MTVSKELAPELRAYLEARKDYFDSRLNDLSNRINQAETNRNESMNRAYSRLQEGLDKVEKQVQSAMSDAEKRIAEKFDNRDRSVDKAAEVIDERLEQMNQFRDQISQERRLYTTRDQLETAIAGIKDQMDIMKRTLQLTAGKDAGINRVWGIIVVVASLLLPIIVTLAGKLL